MAKQDLLGGTLWEQYSQKVADRMNNPRNRGEITEEEAKAYGARLVIADWGAEACGDAVRLYLLVDPETDRIIKAKFKSFGCGTAIASSDMMTELCVGKTVDEAMKITNLDVEKALRDDPELPAVPPQKMHCSVMAYDVIKKAASIYKGIDLEKLEEEEIVCECARVSLRTIKEVIRLNNLKTVEEITQYTKAGAFCKSCIRPGGHEQRKYYLVDILAEVRAQMDKEEVKKSILTDDFRKMSLVRKLKEIEKVLDENVRPILAKDGGNLEVFDIKESENYVDIYFKYSGKCQICVSGKINTASFIEQVLKEKLG
ncbi:MAG: iron-sulfur cluster assembly scaffold protein, partial [Brevinematia bacterium]